MARKRDPNSTDLNCQIDKLTKNLKQLPGIAGNASVVFEEQVALRLSAFQQQLDEFNRLTLSFDATETWRTVYQRMLESCETHRYLSVALIKSDEYWRDEPGRSSLEFNYRLLDHGFTVRRVFIIDPFFWPPTTKTPAREILNWIVTQNERGIITSLVRLADLENEPDLICDMGIYGTEAVGKQIADFDGRTVRFRLYFDRNRIREAEDLWNRIQLFAVQIEDLIE